MPEAGWYEDPHNPSQQRYWDGSTWTEHTHDAPFHMPQAPVQGQEAQFGAPVSHRPGFINDIGEWLSRSFKVLFSNAMPLFLLLLLGILPAMVPFWALTNAVEDVVIDLNAFSDDGTVTEGAVTGFSGGAVTLGVLAVIVASLVAALLTLAQSYLLHRGHIGQQASLGNALAAGAKGLPRYAGWWLAITIAAMVIFIIIAILIGILGAIGGLIGFLLFLLLIPFGIWFWVKTSFLSVSSAVAPKGESALRASTERSSSRFWGVFGRLLLLVVITAVVNGIVQSFASASIIQGLSFGSGGSLTVNGTPIEDLDQLRLGDLFVFNSAVVTGAIISGLLAGAVGLYARSGLAGLYADLSGPSDHVVGSATAS